MGDNSTQSLSGRTPEALKFHPDIRGSERSDLYMITSLHELSSDGIPCHVAIANDCIAFDQISGRDLDAYGSFFREARYFHTSLPFGVLSKPRAIESIRRCSTPNI